MYSNDARAAQMPKSGKECYYAPGQTPPCTTLLPTLDKRLPRAKPGSFPFQTNFEGLRASYRFVPSGTITC